VSDHTAMPGILLRELVFKREVLAADEALSELDDVEPPQHGPGVVGHFKELVATRS
jgi:hypothetical protein